MLKSHYKKRINFFGGLDFLIINSSLAILQILKRFFIHYFSTVINNFFRDGCLFARLSLPLRYRNNEHV
jgi:hypothetical protein